jgi:hypothetical protein
MKRNLFSVSPDHYGPSFIQLMFSKVRRRSSDVHREEYRYDADLQIRNRVLPSLRF